MSTTTNSKLLAVSKIKSSIREVEALINFGPKLTPAQLKQLKDYLKEIVKKVDNR